MQKHILIAGYCASLVLSSSCGSGSQENQDQPLEGQEEISTTDVLTVDTADATDFVSPQSEATLESIMPQGTADAKITTGINLTQSGLSETEIPDIVEEQRAITGLVETDSDTDAIVEVAEEQGAVLAAANSIGEEDEQPLDRMDKTETLTESELSAQSVDLVSSIAISEASPDQSPDPVEEIFEDATAFTGALGWAAETTTGGRGGRVVIVDTLSNAVNPNDGVTSFREAMTEINEPRIIVFSVAGLIDYRSGSSVPDSQMRTNNSDSNVTIACQSAPSPGVTLMGDGIVFAGDTNNVIMRHCRFRNSDPATTGAAQNSSCIRATGTTPNAAGEIQRNYVIDHVSCMWAADDPVTFALIKLGDPRASNNMQNITISNSIVSEGDADSLHEESGQLPNRYTHAMGPSCLSSSASRLIERCSIVRNFIAHNARRNGLLWAVDEGELINNIVYNPSEVGLSAKQRPTLANHLDAIISGNLIQFGPTSKSTAKAIDLLGNNSANSQLEISGNYQAQYRANSAEPYDSPPYSNSNTPRTRQVTPSLDILEISRQGSDHLRCVGASRPHRDSHDARVIEEFHQQSGQVGILSHHERDFSEYNTVPVQQSWSDIDHDGMPDSWETKMGVDEANDYDLSLDYTNLEVFLNGLALCPSVMFESESISVPAGTREVEISFETTWETWADGQTLKVCIDNACESHDDFARRGSFVASLPYDANYKISMTPIGADGIPESVSDSIDVFVGQ